MKLFYRLISVCLAFALIVCGIPAATVLADGSSKDYPIFAADPLRAGGVGSNASASSQPSQTGTPYVAEDEDGAYYTFTSSSGDQWNRRFYLNTGFDQNQLGWLEIPNTLRALNGFLTYEVDIRAQAVSGIDTGSDPYLEMAITSPYNALYMRGGNISNSVYGEEWMHLSGAINSSAAESIYSGNLYISLNPVVNAGSTGVVKVDVRNFKITINSAEKDDINKRLAEAGSSWTYNSLVKTFAAFYATDDVVYAANPLWAGNPGSKVNATERGSSGDTYVVEDENGAYFQYKITYPSADWYWSQHVFFNGGVNNSLLPSLNEQVMNVLKEYGTMRVEYRVSGSGLGNAAYVGFGVSNSDDFVLYAERLPSIVNQGWQVWTAPIRSNLVPYSGSLYAKICPEVTAANSTMTVDIRSVQFTINSADKDDIDAAFAAAGSSWTYDRLIKEMAILNSSEDVIFAANPNSVQVLEGDSVVPTNLSGNSVPMKGVTSIKRKNVADGSYFENHMRLEGNDGGDHTRTVIDSGVNAETPGFGWLANGEVVGAIMPYADFSFEVRGQEAFTSSGKVDFYVSANNRNQQIATLTAPNIANYGTWTKISGKVNNKFAANSWQDGYFAMWLYSWENTNTASGIIDVRNIRFTVKSVYRQELNATLAAVEGINNIENFTKGIQIALDEGGNPDYYSLLTGAATVASKEVFEAADDYYTIWYADAEEQADASSVDVVDINPTSAVGSMNWPGSVCVDIDNDGQYYYSTQIETNGLSGGNTTGTVLVPPINNNTLNYGWIANTDILNAVAPYLYFAYDYRIPDTEYLHYNTQLYIRAAGEWNYDLATLGCENLTATEDWITKTPQKIAGTFAGQWYNGYVQFSVYSDYGLPSTMLIDFRNMRLQLRKSDRAAIDEALAKAGLKIRFDDLCANDPTYDACDTIWYASANRAAAKGNVLNTTLSTSGAQANVIGNNTYKVTQPVSGVGSTDRTVVKSGFTADSKGFGWMSNNQFLSLMKNYFYVSFDYRTDSAVPQDAKLLISAAGASNSTLFAKADLYGKNEWTTYYGKISASSLGDAWNGDFEVALESLSGAFASGATVSVEIKNLSLRIKYSDQKSINAMFPTEDSFVRDITNFCDGELDRAVDTIGGMDYIDIYSHLTSAIPNIKFDANDDDSVDIRDLVSIKKYCSGISEWSRYQIKRCDSDNNGSIAAGDLTAMRRFLLTDAGVEYNDPIIVDLVQDHPGVVNMDAVYQLKLTDRATGNEITSGYSVSVNNNAVTVSGLTLTVPYEVRSSALPLTVTVTSGDKTGRYTFRFQKFGVQAFLRDDFDTLNNDVWTTGASEHISFENGALKFTGDTTGESPALYSKDEYALAYGSFSARIKMPAQGVLANCAFWLRTKENTEASYLYNPLNPMQSGGEIDIVEYFPTWGDRWSSSVHWYGWSGCHRQSGVDNLSGTSLANTYHIYSAVWTPYGIYSYLDGELCRVYQGSGLSEDSDPMQTILGMGVFTEDSAWGGKYDASKLPAYMYVDWYESYALAD